MRPSVGSPKRLSGDLQSGRRRQDPEEDHPLEGDAGERGAEPGSKTG